MQPPALLHNVRVPPPPAKEKERLIFFPLFWQRKIFSLFKYKLASHTGHLSLSCYYKSNIFDRLAVKLRLDDHNANLNRSGILRRNISTVK